jgi:hypothetical protein
MANRRSETKAYSGQKNAFEINRVVIGHVMFPVAL